MPSSSSTHIYLALTAAVLPSSAQRGHLISENVDVPSTPASSSTSDELIVGLERPIRQGSQRSARSSQVDNYGYAPAELSGTYMKDGRCYKWNLGCVKDEVRTLPDGSVDCGPTDENLMNITMTCEPVETAQRGIFTLIGLALLGVVAVGAVKLAIAASTPYPRRPQPPPRPHPYPPEPHPQTHVSPTPHPTTPYPPAEVTVVKLDGARDDNAIKMLDREGSSGVGTTRVGRRTITRRGRSSRRSRASVRRIDVASVGEAGNAAIGSTDCRVGAVSCVAFYAMLGTALLCVVTIFLAVRKTVCGPKGSRTAVDGKVAPDF